MRTIAFRPVWLCALIVAGCKGPEYHTAPVKGKVTFQGRPVTSGQLFFHPLEEKDSRGNNPGKPAFANIDKDGNYQLSTYDVFDGAVIGRHRVSFVVAPEEQAAAEAEGAEGRPTRRAKASYQIAPDQAERTIVAGENVIDFELLPASKS